MGRGGQASALSVFFHFFLTSRSACLQSIIPSDRVRERIGMLPDPINQSINPGVVNSVSSRLHNRYYTKHIKQLQD